MRSVAHHIRTSQLTDPMADSKVAVIAGYGSGISAAVAKRFGAEGYKLALLARTQSRLDEAVAGKSDTALLSRTQLCISIILTLKIYPNKFDISACKGPRSYQQAPSVGSKWIFLSCGLGTFAMLLAVL